MYEPHYEEESGGGGFLMGLLCGTALGAAIGLMFAPKAGSEIRQRVYDSTGEIRRKADETYNQASEQVNTMVTKARQAIERGHEAFDSVRQSAAGQTSGGNGTAPRMAARLSLRRFRLHHRPADDRRRIVEAGRRAESRERRAARDCRGALRLLHTSPALQTALPRSVTAWAVQIGLESTNGTQIGIN